MKEKHTKTQDLNQILPPSEQLWHHFFKPPSVLFVSKFFGLFFLNIDKKTIVMMERKYLIVGKLDLWSYIGWLRWLYRISLSILTSIWEFVVGFFSLLFSIINFHQYRSDHLNVGCGEPSANVDHFDLSGTDWFNLWRNFECIQLSQRVFASYSWAHLHQTIAPTRNRNHWEW